MRIGIDFDNTIIDYGNIFTKQAYDFGWIDIDVEKTKQQVRDAVRALPEGKNKWRQLQSLVYGRLINEANPFEGVREFIGRCVVENIDVFVISHKTEYAEASEERINLREAAFHWLCGQGFFGLENLSLDKNKIFFEHPRKDKIQRIRELGCTYFIDDLEDVLLDPQFPRDVTAILFSDTAESNKDKPFKVCRHWREIEELVFRYAESRKQ